MLFVCGYEFLDPPPELTADGAVAGPSDGARKLNVRTAFFYPYTGITPAMCMRLTGLGSQYLIGPGQPVRHGQNQPGRLDRHLLRTHATRRQGNQLAPDHPG